jgi:hypothetical protein
MGYPTGPHRCQDMTASQCAFRDFCMCTFILTNRIFYFSSNRDGANRFAHGFNVRPRTLITFLKIVLPTAFLLGFFGLYRYEPHIELAFYDRDFVSTHIESIEPLSSKCWDPNMVSSSYNLTEGLHGLRRTEVHAGLPMRMGFDCYDLAGTIKHSPNQHPSHNEWWPESGREERVQYHTYWRSDLAAFGPRQEWMLKSFFATQSLERSQLILWSNGDLGQNPILQKYLTRYPQAFALRIVDIPKLAVGTELEGSSMLESKDKKAWVDGDLIRLLLLWNYGGVWIDMDSLFTRNLEPLLEHEFVTQWDCYGTLAQPFCTVNLFAELSHRQSLPAFQRCSDALPQALTLPLRSLPHHGHPPATPERVNRLGLPPLLQALAQASSRRRTPLQSPPILLFRRPLMPTG